MEKLVLKEYKNIALKKDFNKSKKEENFNNGNNEIKMIYNIEDIERKKKIRVFVGELVKKNIGNRKMLIN